MKTLGNDKVSKVFKSPEPLPIPETKAKIKTSVLNKTDSGDAPKLLNLAVDLEHENQTLRIKLQRYNKKHRKLSVNLTEANLVNFSHYGECDQKLLALMFWDKLTPQQKDVFSDEFYKEAEEEYKKKIEDRMSDPTKMRQHFLNGAAPILDDIVAYANGNKKNAVEDKYYVSEVWDVLKGIISTANAPAPLVDLKGKEVSDQIDEILTQVTAGNITFDAAKEYMSLVSAGFNLQELPKLMAALEAIESK